MNERDTIAAISTAPGVGAIAIVRISGENALKILEKIFSGSPEQIISLDWKARSHEAVHGYIWNPETLELIDEVVAISYKGPNTYTGEDLVEINCHGSPLLAREILDMCIGQGARLSQKGEFTQRAFMSGRMDLTQAEAVLDLIQAKTTRQSRGAVSVLKGHLGARIKNVREWLVELLGRIVAGIDFPEEVGEIPLDDLREVVERSRSELEKLSRTARTGRFLRDGLKLSIVGRPNAGKSSLLNQLLAFERAIVTDVPGTTRDSIEELFEINGIPVMLIDTAGVRTTEDKVELIGIERTQRAVAESDLALMVVDLTQPWGQEEQEVLDLVGDLPFIMVLNKCDLASLDVGARHASPISNVHDQQEIPDNCLDKFHVSAKTGEGMESLKARVELYAAQDNAVSELGGSLNQRQAQLCAKALESLDDLEQTIVSGMPQDCLATDLKTAVHCLSEASGEEVSEEIMTEIFSRFCIGK